MAGATGLILEPFIKMGYKFAEKLERESSILMLYVLHVTIRLHATSLFLAQKNDYDHITRKIDSGVLYLGSNLSSTTLVVM